MKKFPLLLACALMLSLSACHTSKKQASVQKSLPALPMPGEPISKINRDWGNYEQSEVEAWFYGLDGGGNGTVVHKGKEDYFFYFDYWRDGSKIGGIVTTHPGITIGNGYHVGMTVKEVLKKSPEATFTISLLDEDMEYIYLPDEPFSLEIDQKVMGRAGAYDEDDSGEAVLREVVNPEVKITRITCLYKED